MQYIHIFILIGVIDNVFKHLIFILVLFYEYTNKSYVTLKYPDVYTWMLSPLDGNGE